jgi:hypothetical protein
MRETFNKKTIELMDTIGDDSELLGDVLIMSRLKMATQDNPQLNFSASDWMSTSQEVKQAINKMLSGEDFTTTAELWFTTPQAIKKIIAHLNKKTPIITGAQTY